LKIKYIAEKTISTSFKLLWAVLCYIFSLLLAVVSAYFTVIFYSDGSIGNDFFIMSFLAISLEGVKLIFSVGYPYMKYRNKKSEQTVLLILKISFVVSVLSSVYFLMLGSDIEKSPASKTVTMLYNYVPVLNIIPLGFAQFLSTISLSLLIEFFIIYLPVVAPVMFYEKNNQNIDITKSNFEKIKEIFSVIPDMIINTAHKKVMKLANGNYKTNEIAEPNRPKLKLLKRMDFVEVDKKSNILQDSDSANKKVKNKVIAMDKVLKAVQDSKSKDKINNIEKNISSKEYINSYKNINLYTDDNRILLKEIFRLKDNDICPSVKQLEKATGLTKNKIHEIKRLFEDLEILKTDKNKTVLLLSYKESLKQLKVNK
jgi:hypothetical protein